MGDEVTGQEMCERIAAHWQTAHGVKATPKSIWCYSSRGELSRVFAWYEEVLTHEEHERAAVRTAAGVQGTAGTDGGTGSGAELSATDL